VPSSFRHDDITYSSIAKGFGLGLKLHDETLVRMKKLSRSGTKKFDWDTPSAQLTARLRMVELPIDTSRDEKSQVLFVSDDLWVPINVVNGNVHILPGIPRLFTSLLDGLKPLILPRVADPEGKGIARVLISTPLPESEVAGYLTELAAKVESNGVKVGSYPRWGHKRNTVTLVGKDAEYIESLVEEVCAGVQGVRVASEDELDEPETS
jgi:molybdopterin-biosynthesis enzyme MoeA-like protein